MKQEMIFRLRLQALHTSHLCISNIIHIKFIQALNCKYRGD